jgi:hypothetical protein
LPQKKKVANSFDKYNFILNGLLDGVECLEDLDELKAEAVLIHYFIPSPQIQRENF